MLEVARLVQWLALLLHNKKVLGLNLPANWGSFCVESCANVLFFLASFLPQPKDIQIWSSGYSLKVSVNNFISVLTLW